MCIESSAASSEYTIGDLTAPVEKTFSKSDTSLTVTDLQYTYDVFYNSTDWDASLEQKVQDANYYTYFTAYVPLVSLGVTVNPKYYGYYFDIDVTLDDATLTRINTCNLAIGTTSDCANRTLTKFATVKGSKTYSANVVYKPTSHGGLYLFAELDAYIWQYEQIIDSKTTSTFKINNPAYSLSGSVKYSRAYMLDNVTSVIEHGNELQTESNAIQEETKETTKGIFSSITDFFGSFFQNLIDSVIGLFVPSSEEMSGLFDQLNQFFSDRFGFLYGPFDYMIQLLGVFTSAEGSTGLTFPGFSIMGYEVWPDLTYDLASDELVGTILEYVRIGTGILLGGWFIMYLQDFFKERFSQ